MKVPEAALAAVMVNDKKFVPEPEPSTEQLTVSYSELDTYRQCPLKHHLSYRMRYTKPPRPDGALAKGSLYHLVMEEHYKTVKHFQDRIGGMLPREAWQTVLDEARARVRPFFSDPTTGEQSDVQSLIEWMYEGYVANYGVDPGWRILATEHQINTPLRDREGRHTRYVLKAKIDLIVRDNNGNEWVIDHKSGRDLPTTMDLEIDDQFGLYTWALREVGRPVLGAIHSANRTQRNKSAMPLETRMSRTYLNRTDAEVQNLALDALEVAKAAYPEVGKPAMYSSPDPRQCGWKCDYKEPHLLMRRGMDPHQVMTEYGYKINRERH